MQEQWASLKGGIDGERHAHVQALLEIQLKEARWWRDACLLYFQTFSGKALPDYIPRPEHGLEYYQGLEFPFAPGIRPRW